MRRVTTDAYPVLTTERLRLRRLVATDVPALFAIFSDPETTRFWSQDPYRSPAEAEALLAKIDEGIAKNELFEWGVTRTDDDRVIGKVCHHRWMKAHWRSEVGYIIHREAWRQGFATEAMRAILGFGWAAMRLHSTEAQVDPRNLASVRVLERLGFVKEGHLRESYFHRGLFTDTAIYSLLRPAAV